MALIPIYQGEDKAFSIKVWTDNSKTELVDLDNVNDIIAIMYTEGVTVARFSKTDKTADGYKRLTRVSSTEYSAIIESDATSVMAPGIVYLETKIKTTDLDLADDSLDGIGRAAIAELKKSEIKSF